MTHMTDETAAAAFAAMGNAHRLAVMRLLVQAGDRGMNVSALRAALDLPASTLAHHLRHLAGAGLVAQTREGRDVISTADYAAIQALSTFLMKDCCRAAFPTR